VGRLFSWGSNSAGQLGIGLPVVSNVNVSSSGRHLTSESITPPLVHCVDSLRGVAVAHIAAGSQHSTALSVSGALFTWGFNRSASLLVLSLLSYVIIIIIIIISAVV